MNTSNVLTAFLTTIFTLSLLPTAPACAGVTNITAGHQRYCATITQAVTLASNGDTLLVSTGIYTAPVDITAKNLYIDGRYNREFTAKSASGRTIVDVSAIALVGSVIDITNATVTLIDIDMTGGDLTSGNGGGLHAVSSIVTAQACRIYGNAGSGASYGGGVYADFSTLILSGTQVCSNSARYGGGIYGDYSRVEMQGASPVFDNVADVSGVGGGIRMWHSSLLIDNSAADVYRNTAGSGGGIAVNYGSMEMRSDADLYDNHAGHNGGGILLENGATGVVHGAGTRLGWFGAAYGPNTASNGGGIYVINASLVLSNYAEIAHNAAESWGGGVWASNSFVLIDSSAQIGSFSTMSNTAAFGGGIFAMDSDVVITNATVMYAAAKQDGGGVYALRGTLALVGSTILSNRSYDAGGGIFAAWLTSVVTSCRISGNTAAGSSTAYGGGLYSYYGTAILDDTLVFSNSARYGGGIYGHISHIELHGVSPVSDNAASVSGVGGGIRTFHGSLIVGGTDADIIGNTASNGAGIAASFGHVELHGGADLFNNRALVNGGGMLLENGATGVVHGVSTRLGYAMGFGPNTASNGGAVYVISSLLVVSNRAEIAHNRASVYGGGVYATNSSVLIADKAVIGTPGVTMSNVAAYGGGIYAMDSDVVITNATVMCATARLDGGGAYALRGTVALVGATIVSNIAHRDGGGIYASDGALDVRSTLFQRNACSNIGGAVYLDTASGTFDSEPAGALPGTQFLDNEAWNHAGALYFYRSTSTVENVLAAHNSSAIGYGGAMYVSLQSRVRCVNAVIVSNRAMASGGVRPYGAQVSLEYCTIADNQNGGVIIGAGGLPTLTNCVVWGNGPTNVSAEALVAFSDIEGGFVGTGNIDANPQFASPATLDYQLTVGSPCTNSAFNIGITSDCIGTVRPQLGGFDMGAYEFVPEPCLAGVLVLLALLGRTTARNGRSTM